MNISAYLIPGLIRSASKEPDTIASRYKKLAEAVSKATGISVEDIRHVKSKREVAYARHLVVFGLMKFHGYGPTEVAKIVGFDNHTSVYHSLKTITGYLSYDEETINHVQQIKSTI